MHQRRTAHVDVGTVQTSSFEVNKVALWVGLVQVTEGISMAATVNLAVLPIHYRLLFTCLL